MSIHFKVAFLIIAMVAIFWPVCAEQQRRTEATAEQQRVADENKHRNPEVQKAEKELREAKDRSDYGAAMNGMFSRKAIQGVTVLTTNWDAHHAPPATLANYTRMDKENNRLLVIWTEQGSAVEMATRFINSRRASQDRFKNKGFYEVQFVDPINYCYASVVPVLGLSELRCQLREDLLEH